MVAEIWVNIGSGNGLLSDGTKPLPEPMLTYDQWCVVAFTWWQFHKKYLRYLSLKWVWNLLIWECSQIPQGPMINCPWPIGACVRQQICHHWYEDDFSSLRLQNIRQYLQRRPMKWYWMPRGFSQIYDEWNEKVLVESPLHCQSFKIKPS